MYGTFKIDDTLTLYMQTASWSSGAETDADSLPTARIYKGTSDTPVYTFTYSKLDDAGTTGFYAKDVPLSVANGFSAGCYCVRGAAIVGTIHGAKVMTTFRIK